MIGNIADLEDENVARFGEYPATWGWQDGKTWTSTALLDHAQRLAGTLRELGIAPGDHVLVLLPNRPEVLFVSSAIWRVGAVLVLAFVGSPASELERIVAHCAPAAVVTTAGVVPKLDAITSSIARRVAIGGGGGRAGWLDLDELIAGRPPLAVSVARADSDPIVITYTSGTTGTPKGVVFDHRGTRAMIEHVRRQEHQGWGLGPVNLAAMPVASAGGQPLKLRFATKKAIVLVEEFEPERILSAIERHRVTECMLVPSMCEVLLASPGIGRHDYSSLRLVALSGAVVPSVLVERFEAAFGIRPSIFYGMTEAAWGFSETNRSSKTGSVGRLRKTLEVKIVDAAGQPAPPGTPGEILARSPYLAVGYHKAPAETAAIFADGWLHTGDLGYFDRDGELFLVGRSKEMIIQSGVNVYTAEVIDVLMRLAGVADSAVVGLPDPLLGEAVVACVVRSSPDAPSEADVLAHCRAAMDPRKVPARVVFLDELPRNAFGKIRTAELRERVVAVAASTRSDEAPLAAQLRAAAARDQRAVIEPAVAAAFAAVLGMPGIEPDDNFFARGGSSVLAVRVLAQVQQQLGITMSAGAFFGAPTVRGVAAVLEAAVRDGRAVEPQFRVERTAKRSGRARSPQETFWYLVQSDPDSPSYSVQVVHMLEGPLDRGALQQAARAVVGRHDIFRTELRERDGTLFQFVTDEPAAFELELVEQAPEPESAYAAEIDRHVAELLTGIDLTTRRTIRGRLVVLAPERHALILLVHHAFADAASAAALPLEIFEHYARVQRGEPARGAPRQYLDYCESVQRFAESPAGRAREAWWSEQLRDAPALEIPLDTPRAEHAARRTAPYGLDAEPIHHPMFQPELPAPTRERVSRAAAAEGATPAIVYLAAYAWLLRELTGQHDICIENASSQRGEHGVGDIQGAVASRTLTRIDTSGCRSLRDAIDKTRRVVSAVLEHGLIPDYHRVVPPGIKRATFNYIPLDEPRAIEVAPGLSARRHPRPWPRFKRPWELFLAILDSPRTTRLFWSGAERSLRRETLGTWLDRYLALLDHELA